MVTDVKSGSTVVSPNITKQLHKVGRKLAGTLKSSPELAKETNFLEALSLFACIDPISDTTIYPICHEFVRTCLKSLSPNSLRSMWADSQQLELCASIINETTIDPAQYFEKVCHFIENPDPSPIWFRMFLAILSSSIPDTIPTEHLHAFTALLTDSQPLRSVLACQVLLNFKSTNTRIAYAVTAAWIVCPHKSPLIAENCRRVITKADPKVQNFISSLAIEVHSALCILPADVPSFNTAANMVIYLLSSFSPELLHPVLEMSSKRAREIAKEPGSISLPLRFLDSIGETQKPQVGELDPDICAAIIQCGRYTTEKTASFLPNPVRNQIMEVLRSTVSNVLPESEFPPIDVDPQSVLECTVLIETNQIRSLHELERL